MYRNYVFVFFMCLMLVSAVNAQTFISGSVSGTWPAGVYYATDSLLVESGNTLTILPGVELYFQVDQKFQVEGTLNINGNETDSVLITYDSESVTEFAGIRYLPGSSGNISYTRVDGGVANSVDITGGGIYIFQADVDISNSLVQNCSANIGGGVFYDESTGTAENNEFRYNYADFAAGVYIRGSITFQNNRIHHNVAGNNGGGFNLSGPGTSVVENNLIYNNEAQNGGGIAFVSASEALGVMNNTVYNNTATGNGGGVYLINAVTSGAIRNTVIYGNSAGGAGQQIYINQGYLDIDYSDVQGGEEAIGINENFEGSYLYGAFNVDDDPGFTDPGNADFNFAYNSPIVDTGTNLGAAADDFYGNPRPFDGDRDDTDVVDIGAIEYTNTAPSISSTPVTSATEDQPYTYDADATDPDLDEVLTFSLSGEPEFLSIDDVTGEITGLPDNDDVGPHNFSVVVTDLNGATGTQNFTLDVENVNDAPVVSDIPDQGINEGGVFTAIALDTYVDDVDNTDAQITWVASGNVGLLVSINPATRVAVITTPNANWSGSERITFTATDPGILSDADDAVFTVTSVNDPPVVSDIEDQQIEEGQTFATINLDDYVDDVDHTDAQITWNTSGETELAVSIVNRVATIQIPDTDWNGSETITFTATDPLEGEDSDDATFEVTSVNDLPVVTDIPNQTVAEGATFLTISLDDYVSDVDHTDDQMTWTYGGNTDLTVDITARVATIGIPNVDWYGSETITFTATDPEDGADGDDATFEVTSVNDLPVVTDIPGQTIAEGATFATISLDDFVSDVDHTDDQMTWTYGGNTDLTVDITARVATITAPSADWNGSEEITFTATDPELGADSDPATFLVTSENDFPIVTDIPDQTIAEGGTFATINLDDYVSDVDHTDAQITWTYSGNTDLTVDITARVATIGIPNVDWHGSELITFTATDPEDGNNSDGATFEVTSVNDVPVVTDIPDQTIAEGATFATINLDDFVADADHADDEMEWTYAGNSELTVTITNRVATIGIPNVDWYGSEALTFTVTDPEEDSANDGATFEVTSVNDLPIISDLPDQNVEEGSSFPTINLDDYVSDADHADDVLVWTYAGNVELTVDITARVATVTIPSEDWIGVETITFTVTDPEEGSAEEAVMFEVNNINDPPVISDIEPQVFNEDETLTYSIAEIMENVHDPDHHDSLLTFIPVGGENIVVELVDDTLVVFSAPDNWNGLDTLSLFVSDGELDDTALIYFEVKAVNDVPFFTASVPDTVVMYMSEEEEMNLSEYADDVDLDIEGDSLRWEVSVSDDTLKFEFDPETLDLVLTAPGYMDSFTLTMTVTDDSGATAEETITIDVMADPTGIENLETGVPTSYVLKQNYPNPFNPSTHIKFGLPQAGDVLVEVYNLIGQKIVTLFNGYKAAGYHVVDFDASNLPSGIYFYRIKADKFQNVKKMMLVK